MTNGAKQRARALGEKYKDEPPATYDALSGKRVEFGDGYQVSFVRDEAWLQLSDYKWDKLTAHIMKRTGSGEYVGVTGGIWKPETSFWCESLEQAKEIAEMFNQESILDWAMKKQYPNDDNKWYKVNTNYVGEMEVNYDEIIENVSNNNG
jgi:hypothetical protein